MFSEWFTILHRKKAIIVNFQTSIFSFQYFIIHFANSNYFSFKNDFIKTRVGVFQKDGLKQFTGITPVFSLREKKRYLRWGNWFLLSIFFLFFLPSLDSAFEELFYLFLFYKDFIYFLWIFLCISIYVYFSIKNVELHPEYF